MNPKEIQLVALLELIAPSPDFEAEGGKATELSQDVRDSIKSLWENGLPWEDVFAPIEDVVLRTRYIDLFNKLEELKTEADA